jgi:uncharacterized membrane protein YkoI
MNKKTISRKFLLGGVGAVALIAIAAGGGYALTAADEAGDDQPIPAADREQAEQAALAETGGGTVTDSELDDEQSKYEIEVTLDDGTQVDVQLDEDFGVVSSETDGPEDAGDDSDDTDDSDDRAVPATDREQAERAALAETGGGTVTSTEADDQSGYEVEVTLDDGTEVDVHLDESFEVISSRTDGTDDGDDD